MRTLILAVTALSLAACGEKAYRVGVMSRGAVYEGADLATREINGKNGIDGKPLRVALADTATTGAADARQDSAASADRLTSDTTVRFVLQASAQGVSPALLRVYYSRAVPVVVVGPLLGKPDGRWVFHMLPSAHEEARLMTDAATKLWQPKRVVIAHSSNLYGEVLAAEIQNMLPGATFVAKTPFTETTDTTRVAAVERSIASVNPDVLYWIGQPRVLAILLSRLRGHLPNLRVMGSDATEGKRLYDNQDSLFTGLVFVRGVNPSGDTARFNSFQYRYSLWQGGQGTSEALLAYDVTTMIAQAMRSGAVTRQQIRDYLLSLGRTRPAYDGITGPIAFDSTGVLQRPMGLAEVRDDGVKSIDLQATTAAAAAPPPSSSAPQPPSKTP